MSYRCRVILRCADGLSNKAVAAEFGVRERTVGKWRRRFLKDRIDGLSDDPRPGRPRTIADKKVAEVIERTLTARPADPTQWSLRLMAKEAGLSHTTIWRIWGAFGLQPHRVESFKLFSDPHFVDKVRDINAAELPRMPTNFRRKVMHNHEGGDLQPTVGMPPVSVHQASPCPKDALH